MTEYYQDTFDPDDPEFGLDSGDPTESIDWGPSLNKEITNGNKPKRSTVSRNEFDYDLPPIPEYDPKPRADFSKSTYPKLTQDDIRKYIDAKCWINGTYISSLDTEYLINCKKFASQRFYDRWYWKYFLNLINEEIMNRDKKIGPRRYYPGTENIPRRGDNNGYRYKSARYRNR